MKVRGYCLTFHSIHQIGEVACPSLLALVLALQSGKLVMKMFQKIEEFVEDEEALVFVLIDEVESLTSARKAAMSGSEPSDAIRVVNALLTQLDHIKK
jgi:SpoVK/Ycf46/Vps4 family AAA+-type ATPase